MAEKIYSFEEVEKHNKKDDCWVIIFGKVFDVTRFLEDHPGGPEILLMTTGKDASVDFETLPHSERAYEKMKEFCIGEIDPSTFPTLSSPDPDDQAENAPPTSNDGTDSGYFSSKISLNLLPLLMVGVAMIMFFYSKKE